MSSFRSRARRVAFGDSTEELDDASSITSNQRSSSSTASIHGPVRHSTSLSEVCNCPSQATLAHVPPKRTNRVQRIHRSQPFELFVEALEADGCVVVEDFVSGEIPERAHVAGEFETKAMKDETKAQTMALDVNAMVRDNLLSDALYQTLSTHFLALETISWRDGEIQMNTCKPQISASHTRNLNDECDSATDSFHRADSTYHARHTAAAKYDYQSRRDVCLGLLVPELDSLSARVSIAAIPGSHLWDDQKPDVTKGMKQVELRGGEAMILLGSLYHALGCGQERSEMGGSVSGTVREKLVHEMLMGSGIYRPQADVEHVDDEV